MPLVAAICPSNQWPAPNFWRQVAHNEDHELKEAAAFGRPIDRKDLRDKVLSAILSYAHPAGNA